MRILILGGDGYLGWPQSLYLSSKGHDVTITEQFSLVELAETVVEQSKQFGLQAQIKHLPNPRVEAEQHYYNAVHVRLIELGLEPHLLNGSVLDSLIELTIRHREQIDRSLIMPTINWRTTKNEVSRTDY